MNKYWLISVGLCFTIISQFAVANCSIKSVNKKVSVGFFNGVGTSYPEAHAMRNRLSALSKKDAALFYNHTQGFTLDLLEVYQQRVVEAHPELAGRYDLMADMLAGNGAITLRLLASGNAGIAVSIQAFREAAGELERGAMKRVAAMTNMNYREHRSQLQKMAKNDDRVVLVAHSQGNYFVNHAYEALGVDGQGKVEILHVAPASARLHGKYLLSNIDLVIKPLAAADGRSPSDVLSWMESRVSVAADWSGHGFNEVYLNSSLPFVGQVVAAVDGAEEVAGADELYGAYRWEGSIDYRGSKGAAWMKSQFNGKRGTWQTSNGCAGDVVLESLEPGKWAANIRTKRGNCPARLDAHVVAVGQDGKRVAVLPFGVSEWMVGAVKPVLAGFGIKVG